MSTPSTATATLPPPHPHYGYHHQGFQSGTNGYHANNPLLNGHSRLANSHYGFHGTSPPTARTGRRTTTVSRAPPQNANMSASESSSKKRSRQRTPNWREFYKNGLPKEVIVIDDDTPPPSATLSTYTAETAKAPRPNHTTRTVAESGTGRHAAKKRKTAASGSTYDPVYQQPASYSTTQTPHFGDSPATTISTDRTTSAIHTTAATSLGSHYSQSGVGNGSSAYPPEEDSPAGHKRKRTRKQVADEAKRRNIEVQGDAYSSYVPPPKPPIKAKDVYVAVAQDHGYSKHQKVDDQDGHYIVIPESNLTERYFVIMSLGYCLPQGLANYSSDQVTRLLGQGTFGKVVEAYDKVSRTKCAIKIIRSVQKYRDASRIELRVLSTLSSNDKENRNKCIHLRDCFDYRNHICIVTDLLGMSVFDFLKSNSFVPFPSSQIQSFARQLLTSVAFLHDLNLIHTDLKPENILLVNNRYQTFTYNRTIPSSSATVSRQARQRRVLLDTEIRLIDFGSATFDDEYHSSVVSTRHYRAPEIILGLGWSFPCDLWSIGCILVEFFTGDALFQTHDNLEHLAMMESVCGGRIDSKLVKQVNSSGRGSSGNPASKYFKSTRLDYPNVESTKASKKYVKAMKQLDDIIPANSQFNKLFLDLLRKIFLYDPSRRITAKEALKHSWFKESAIDDGTEAAKIRIEQDREKNHVYY